MNEIKKDNTGKYVGGALLLAGITAFFGLDGIGKIKDAFASEPDQTEQATATPDVKPETQALQLESKEPDDGKLNNIVFTSDSPQTQKQESKSPVKQDILILTKTSDKLSSDRKELPKSTEGVQVRRPDFVTPDERANPKEFNQRKFGINEAALQSALVQKTPLTRQQKLLIEAEKARTVFDSRSISNF